MKKIKNLTKRIFNAKRVGTLAMLLFCGVAATYAQNAAGDYTAGTNALTTVTEEIAKYVPYVVKLCYAIAGVVAVVGAISVYIAMNNEEQDVKKKIMSMYTDPTHIQISDPGHVEGNTVFTYLDAFSKPGHFEEYLPEYANLQELKDHYTRGGLGDVKIKKFLNNIMQEELSPIRARRAEYEKDIPAVYEILRKGSETAREAAAQTMAEVKRAMRINYFEDAELIKSQSQKYAEK